MKRTSAVMFVQILTKFAILTSLCVGISTSIQAQSIEAKNLDWVTKWVKQHPAPGDTSAENAWMSGDRTYTGLAYDKFRDVVYVVSPGPYVLNGSVHFTPRIFAFQAETGTVATQIGGVHAPPGQLWVDTAVVAGGLEDGKFSLYKIAVDGEGRIFACNAVLSRSNPRVPLRVYRWDSLDAAPRLVYEAFVDTSIDVMGTAFEVTGKQHSINGFAIDSARLYIGGASLDSSSWKDGALHILAAEHDPMRPNDYQLIHVIKNQFLTKKMFGAGIAPINETSTADIYVCAPGKPVYRIRQLPPSHFPPLLQYAQIVDTVYAGNLSLSSGPLAFYVNPLYQNWYMNNCRIAPVFRDTSTQNSNAVVDVLSANGGNQAYRLWFNEAPSLPPSLGNSSPALLAGSHLWIGDVDCSIWIDQSDSGGYAPFNQVYHLLSNGGIQCFRSGYHLREEAELAAFHVIQGGDSLILDWVTATEINNLGFDIERSFISRPWHKIGFVPGFGTSVIPRTYQFVDSVTQELVDAGRISYRLRIIDFDGTSEYSPIREITPVLRVDVPMIPVRSSLSQNYPNPVPASSHTTEIIFALSQPGDVHLNAYTLTGRFVAAILNEWKDAGVYSVRVDTRRFGRGMFWYSLSAKGVSLQRIMIVQ